MSLDDEADLAVHRGIELLVQTHMMQGEPRSSVIERLERGELAHGYDAICEKNSITHDELATRVSAFIEAEKEEEAERAIAAALRAEVDA